MLPVAFGPAVGPGVWTITPPGGAPQRQAGYTLTILRKQNGRWLLARYFVNSMALK